MKKQRINGFNQIKAFYSWIFDIQYKNIKPHHIALYLFLLNQNNRANWVAWFKCPFDLAMTGSCINSKKTYYKCLKELQDFKLIEYQKGSNNWKAPLIKLIVLKDSYLVPHSEEIEAPVVELKPTVLEEDLKNSFVMVNAQARLYKTTEDEIKKHLNNFWLKNYEGQESDKSINDIRNHFTNWLKFQEIKEDVETVSHWNKD